MHMRETVEAIVQPTGRHGHGKGRILRSENVIHEGAVAEVREKMHSGEALDTVAGFFKVLGDGTRMRMISALAVRELCVCDLGGGAGHDEERGEPPAGHPARGRGL